MTAPFDPGPNNPGPNNPGPNNPGPNNPGPSDPKPLDLATLDRWLAAFGADPARWPDPAAGRVLLAASAAARLRAVEASVLDQLTGKIDLTTASVPASEDLLNRIMASVERSPRLAMVNASTVIGEIRLSQGTLTRLPTTAQRLAVQQARTGGQFGQRFMGGLLAASLLLGIGIGLSPFGQSAGGALVAFTSGDQAQTSDMVLAQAAADVDDEPWMFSL